MLIAAGACCWAGEEQGPARGAGVCQEGWRGPRAGAQEVIGARFGAGAGTQELIGSMSGSWLKLGPRSMSLRESSTDLPKEGSASGFGSGCGKLVNNLDSYINITAPLTSSLGNDRPIHLLKSQSSPFPWPAWLLWVWMKSWMMGSSRLRDIFQSYKQ